MKAKIFIALNNKRWKSRGVTIIRKELNNGYSRASLFEDLK